MHANERNKVHIILMHLIELECGELDVTNCNGPGHARHSEKL